jgi:thiosulfate/3-mercaptopyruvate sulfurtransferase
MAKKHKAVRIVFLALVLMFSLTACSVDTTYKGTKNIVEASQVGKDYLAGGKVIVIDAREPEAYAKGHLKGAVSLTPTELSVGTPVPGLLAPKSQIESVLSSKGISNDSIIYVYDDNGGVYSGRVWWVLKVYGHENVMIVNGGSKALVNEKLELSADAAILPATTYTAKDADTSMIATFEDVKSLTETPVDGTVIVDVRSQAEYDAGYIPTAVLYPHTKNLYSDGTFMSSRDLGLFYKDAGITKDENIILYCKTSFRATQTAALLQEAGYTNIKVYDGAWVEWEQKGTVAGPDSPAPVGPSDGS